MKAKRIIGLSLAISSLLSLSSCSFLNDLLTIDFYGPTTTDDEDVLTSYEDLGNYYIDLDPITSKCNNKLINNSIYADAVPSVGDVNLLVIPVEFSDYTFEYAGYSSDEVLYDDLNRVYNGTEEDTGYFTSVSDFYKNSSYGKLNLSFEIAPKYELGMTAKQLKNLDLESDVDKSTYVLEKAVDDYKNKYGNDKVKQFDNDSDGLIDGVMLIYSCHNTGNSEYSTFAKNVGDNGDLYWAYCYWDNENGLEKFYYAKNNKSGHKSNSELIESPIPCTYFWCSYDFIYSYSSCEIGGNVDSHTLDHEFGHMLGLDDYYSYDDSTYYNNEYSRAGYADMMEGNIYDHNAYSKAVLGWINPYVVTGDCTISIRSSALYGDCIILANNYNGTVYDEYIMLELFTPEGMNKNDVLYPYSSNIPTCFTNPGVKIFHIDSRLVNSKTGKEGTYSFINKQSIDLNYAYKFAYSNSKNRDALSTDYDLIKLIHKDKSTGNLNSTSFFGDNSSYYGKNKHLFTKNDEFSVSSYKALFKNNGKLDNNEELNYTVTILQANSSGAVIEFKQNQ